MTTALLFPGQGSQYVGMAQALYEADQRVRSLYELASDQLGEDIAALSFSGPTEKLRQTRFTQPAILLHSLALLTILDDRIPEARFAAGHSLGEYSALTAADVLTAEDAIRAVVVRATAMEQACQAHPGTMATALGLSRDLVMQAIERGSAVGVVVAANINADSQIVASGSHEGVTAFMAAAKELGAKKVIQLEVGGAFHSPLMSPATESLAQFLGTLNFRPPQIPVVPNVTAEPEENEFHLRTLLAEQVTSPVRWADTMRLLEREGVTHVIEIGPGKVLATLARREMVGITAANIDTMADVENFLAQAVPS